MLRNTLDRRMRSDHPVRRLFWATRRRERRPVFIRSLGQRLRYLRQETDGSQDLGVSTSPDNEHHEIC